MVKKRKLDQRKSIPSPIETQEPKSPTDQVSDMIEYIGSASEDDIKNYFFDQVDMVLAENQKIQEEYLLLFIMNSVGSLGPFDLNQIFDTLPLHPRDHDKAILLTLLSNGGSIVTAYQISKLCKSFTKKNFMVAIPRQAKSAATLLSLGADEIHMGPLSELGPIDPQVGGLSALTVSQALKTLAELSQTYPGSSEMLARYLRMVLSVEQIGYCDRVCESAVQYATRLLNTKPMLAEKAEKIANNLVYEYKDHQFVIDAEEAKEQLCQEMIITESAEINFAERIFRIYDLFTLIIDKNSKYLSWAGPAKKNNISILNIPKDK